VKFSLGSLADTQRFAEIIASHVRPRDMIVLAGEMGTGKTTFTQFFGRALGITDLITSPTFNLLHNYGSGRMALHHADLYLAQHHQIARAHLTARQQPTTKQMKRNCGA